MSDVARRPVSLAEGGDSTGLAFVAEMHGVQLDHLAAEAMVPGQPPRHARVVYLCAPAGVGS